MLFQESETGAVAASPKLARAILGTANAADVSRRLDAFCSARLGSPLGKVLYCELSVGAAFGTLLEDGRRVLLKAHSPTTPLEYLRSVHAVQDRLVRAGFPCPKPVVHPASFGTGFITVEDLVDGGTYADAHDPKIRRLSAGTLAWLVRLAGEVPDVGGLARGWGRPRPGELWPKPHNALFDFEAPTAGSGWIEGLAAGARRVLDPPGDNELVVGHADWCSKHLRFDGGRVSAVYDWDSLRLDAEPAIAGSAAVTFPANRHLDAPNLPTPEEAWLFVEDYEAARGRPFSTRQRGVAAAAAIYGLAYLARCEHAADPACSGTDDYRRALAEHADAYFQASS